MRVKLWARMVELGLIAGTRPHAVDGAQLPLVVFSLATSYLMAANLSAYSYAGLPHGARAHLIEAHGDDALRATYMTRMYRGEWAGNDGAHRAASRLERRRHHHDDRVADEREVCYSVRGAKIFISGGGQDITDNIVHMTLARIDGAAAGTKGVSLFCVPARRPGAGDDGALVDNDVAVTQVIHKIGWRGLPSVALAYGRSAATAMDSSSGNRIRGCATCSR